MRQAGQVAGATGGSRNAGLIRCGIVSGFLAAGLGIAAFVLHVLAPRGGAARAQDAAWIASGLTGWMASLLAVLFLVGLLVAGGTDRPARTVAGAVALAATAAATLPHLRFLIEYASYDIDEQFAQQLSDTQTALATAVFAVVAALGALGWVAVALLVAEAAGLGRAGRIAVGVAGLGLLVPVPMTAISLGVAAWSLGRAAEQPVRADAGARLPA